MHYVDRGPEPRGLKKYHDEYTQRWVQYYEREIGSKPTDSHWNKFHKNIGKVFSFLCGYCEKDCKGEVDHFRPKSRFPQKVYDTIATILKGRNGRMVATSILVREVIHFDLNDFSNLI